MAQSSTDPLGIHTRSRGLHRVHGGESWKHTVLKAGEFLVPDNSRLQRPVGMYSSHGAGEKQRALIQQLSVVFAFVLEL